MVCSDCKIKAKERRITCKLCGYDNDYITHTLGNQIANMREEEKLKRRK